MKAQDNDLLLEGCRSDDAPSDGQTFIEQMLEGYRQKALLSRVGCPDLEDQSDQDGVQTQSDWPGTERVHETVHGQPSAKWSKAGAAMVCDEDMNPRRLSPGGVRQKKGRGNGKRASRLLFVDPTLLAAFATTQSSVAGAMGSPPRHTAIAPSDEGDVRFVWLILALAECGRRSLRANQNSGSDFAMLWGTLVDGLSLRQVAQVVARDYHAVDYHQRVFLPVLQDAGSTRSQPPVRNRAAPPPTVSLDADIPVVLHGLADLAIEWREVDVCRALAMTLDSVQGMSWVAVKQRYQLTGSVMAHRIVGQFLLRLAGHTQGVDLKAVLRHLTDVDSQHRALQARRN